VRGDSGYKTIRRNRDSFNPRPCVRGDARNRFGLALFDSFNPRPCVRGDVVSVQI